MIRKHKTFSKPKKPFEAARIKEENVLIERYGLKNKREIWKAKAKVNYFRHRAMDLAKASNEEQEVLFNKLRNIGFKVNSISDVLALTTEDLLNRRLQTIVFKKGFANTPKQARQFIAHRKVLIEGRVNNVPGYIVSIHEEKSLEVIKPKALEVNAHQKKEGEEKVNNG